MKKFLTSLAEGGKPKETDPNAIRYAGLNIRLMANLVDMLLLMVLTLPLMLFKPAEIQMADTTPPVVVETYQLHSEGKISDEEFKQRILNSGYIEQAVLPRVLLYSSLNFLIVGVIYVFCWWRWASTPGKLLFGLKIVDDISFEEPTVRQYIVRFFGYLVSTIPFFIGFLMIGLNKRKKGLHDYMAGTTVIYGKPLNISWEEKKKKWRIYITLIILLIGAVYLSGKL